MYWFSSIYLSMASRRIFGDPPNFASSGAATNTTPPLLVAVDCVRVLSAVLFTNTAVYIIHTMGRKQVGWVEGVGGGGADEIEGLTNSQRHT